MGYRRLVVVAAVVSIGCGDSAQEVAGPDASLDDAPVADAGGGSDADTPGADAGTDATDAGGTGDANPPPDAAPEDTTPPQDATLEDTATPQDIAPQDTAPPQDTSPQDTAPPQDTTPPLDAAPEDAPEPEDAAADTAVSPDTAVAGCPAAEVGAKLGQTDLLVGGAMDASSLAAAPFTIRYQYVAGNVPAAGPCDDCAAGCFVNGQSCANDVGCEWWGCWQWDQEPPGRFIANFVQDTAAAGAVPMVTSYIWFSVAGYIEGAPEVAELADGAKVAALLSDLRFLSQVMAEDPSIPAILHLEPDLWGYAHQVDDDPTQIPAAVSAAGAPECTGVSDSVEGLAACMLAIVHDNAPNVLVALHASAWGAGFDALINANPDFDLAGHAQATADFMKALHADEGDIIVVEMSDRDAGFNGKWWDASDATLPSFAQAIAWVAGLVDGLGVPALWWQVPYGHLGLENICDRYEDNRVDYFFDHPESFAAGGALGIAFGAGAGCMTTAESDDGHFISRAQSYFAADPVPLCGL